MNWVIRYLEQRMYGEGQGNLPEPYVAGIWWFWKCVGAQD